MGLVVEELPTELQPWPRHLLAPRYTTSEHNDQPRGRCGESTSHRHLVLHILQYPLSASPWRYHPRGQDNVVRCIPAFTVDTIPGSSTSCFLSSRVHAKLHHLCANSHPQNPRYTRRRERRNQCFVSAGHYSRVQTIKISTQESAKVPKQIRRIFKSTPTKSTSTGAFDKPFLVNIGVRDKQLQ